RGRTGMSDPNREPRYFLLAQGTDGIQNRLTAQDIAEATIIIHSVAVTPEDNERFESRDVYEITLQDAIKNAAGIIKEIEEMIASEQQ
ncbi:hypothetical protein AAIH62_35545, partial [Pseudomonas aeruginosa]|uniref:hypothetical protein n=1 Tax=Pseudomonas aeruginosa TaxID=287 RepID=UPI0031B7BA2C